MKPKPEDIEGLARAMWGASNPNDCEFDKEWEDLHSETKEDFLEDAKEMLAMVVLPAGYNAVERKVHLGGYLEFTALVASLPGWRTDRKGSELPARG